MFQNALLSEPAVNDKVTLLLFASLPGPNIHFIVIFLSDYHIIFNN